MLRCPLPATHFLPHAQHYPALAHAPFAITAPPTAAAAMAVPAQMAFLTPTAAAITVADVYASPGPRSPLDQLGLVVRRDSAPQAIAAGSADTVVNSKPVPTLDLNLFRSPSIYSVESSLDSISISSEDTTYQDCLYDEPHPGFVSEPEHDDSDTSDDVAALARGSGKSSPATPRANRTLTGDHVGGSPTTRSGTVTPTTAVPLTAKPNAGGNGHPYPSLEPLSNAPGSIKSAIDDGPFKLRPVPGRSARSLDPELVAPQVPFTVTRSSSEPVSPIDVPLPLAQQVAMPSHPQTTTVPDTASMHGEQGIDWGEDENAFEWLDASADAPEATNGATRRRLVVGGASPKRRLSRLTGLRNAITMPTLGVGSSSSTGTSPSSTSPLTTPASAATSASVSPIAPPGASSGSSDSHNRLPSPECGPATEERPRTKKKRPIVIPRRAAPPPPPGASPFPVMLDGGGRLPRSTRTPPLDTHSDASSPSPRTATPPTELPPVVVIGATPPRLPPGAKVVPLHNKTSSRSLLRSESHESGVIVQQSTAPCSSFEVIHGERVTQPQTLPRGRYAKMPLREIDVPSAGRIRAMDAVTPPPPRRGSDDQNTNVTGSSGSLHNVHHHHTKRRGSEPRTPSSTSPASTPLTTHRRSPEDLVSAGLARRDAGDLPKAAWCFMKAAEAGSPVGQMYYGLALRLGAGIHRDERRGFNELVHACDRMLAAGALDLRAAAGTVLTPAQLKSMSVGYTHNHHPERQLTCLHSPTFRLASLKSPTATSRPRASSATRTWRSNTSAWPAASTTWLRRNVSCID